MFKHLFKASAAAVALLMATMPVNAETVLKLGHFGPGPDPFSKSVEAFAERVAELSGGDLTIKVYPAGQLGNEKQQISALQGGLQEMLITSTTNLSNMKPEFSLLDLPFVFSNYAQADAVTMGAVGEKMMEGLGANGLTGLALWENGFRALTNSERAVTSVADMKGMKIRVIGAPVFIDTFTALGTNPVPMPFPELYSAMETGTVDGQDNPAVAVAALKFYEVQKHYTPLNHIYGAMIVLGSESALGRLSDEQRDILTTAARDFGTQQREMIRGADAWGIGVMKENGMEIVESLSADAIAEFKAAVAPVVEASVTDTLRPLYSEMLNTISSASN